MSKFTKFLNLFIPGKTDKGSVVTDVFEPNFSKIDDNAESTDLELKRLEKDKLDKGLVSEEYDTAKKIEDKIKEAKKAGTDAGTEANKKLDKGNVQTKYDTAEKIGNEIDKKFDKGSLPAKISDAKDLYDLIQNNSGLNFDENLLFLNDAGTKYVNKIYFDRNKKGLFKCISQTTSTTNSTSYFVDISNEANADQLRNLIGITTSSLNNNGYVKFLNGLIIQWGTGSGNISFPIPFPNRCFSVTSSSQHNEGWNEDTVINHISRTGFISHLARYGTGYTVSCNWIAIGI